MNLNVKSKGSSMSKINKSDNGEKMKLWYMEVN